MSELNIRLFAGKRYRIEIAPHTHRYTDSMEEAEEIFREDKGSSKIEVWCDKIDWWSITNEDGGCYWCKFWRNSKYASKKGHG